MKRIITSLAAALAALLCLASPAMAEYGLKDLDLTITEADGSPAVQAGSHPFALTTALTVNSSIVPELGEVPDGETKDLRIDLPVGLVGDRNAVPRCSAADFADITEARPACPDSTAVGLAAIRGAFSAYKPGQEGAFHAPVYNLVPPPGVAAQMGFNVLGVPVTIDVSVSSDPPYHLVASLRNISQAVLFYGSKVTIWGYPADPAHDPFRGSCLQVEDPGNPEVVSLGNCPTNGPEKPFLTLPRSCQGPLTTLFSADSWQLPGVTVQGSATTHDDSVPPNPLGLSGCGKLGFAPAISAQPTTTQAESSSGLDFNLDIKDPGITSPSGIAQSDIKKIVTTLPEGVTVNPSSAEGLGVCTVADYEAESLDSAFGAGCPAASKLGTVKATTPLLEEPLEGSLFLAQQDDPATAQPGAENPFDSLLALYLVIKNPQLGVIVKQAAKVEPDLLTGQLITTFEDLPQFPLSHVSLHFREGPRSPLVTPPLCGSYQTKAELTPWSGGAPILASSSFTISQGPNGAPCPTAGVPPFAPGFEAGSLNNNAGSFSSFYMRLTRRDGEQDMTRFDAVLPPGVTGKLAGIPRCPDAAIAQAKTKTGRQELAAPSCPAASALGHVLAGAGVGSTLTYVPGTLYLAGPFGGDPLSIVAIVPALAGPFDAGTVVTREALTLDPNTAEVRVDGAASDPIPHILKGIPLKLRDLRIYADRPEFTLNPTSCDPMATRATLFGDFANVFDPADDVPVPLSSRYQAANCATLPFKPKLTLGMKGGTKRGDHPALQSVLLARPGDANIGRASVTLPPTEFIDNAHINNPCTRVQFNAEACPPSSILGHARAFTPLLDQPLEGPVYFRSNGGERLLPDIVADLRGQFQIVLVGFIDSKNGRIRTRFQNVPDAPVTKFVLNLNGGKKGLLVNNTQLCNKKRHVGLELTGQNGKPYNTTPVLKTSCAKGSKAQRRH